MVATDTPGFVVNHAGRAYGPEALRIVAQGIASPREVDVLMKEAAGFRMGPFELLDLDRRRRHPRGDGQASSSNISASRCTSPRREMAVRVAGGLLGRKTKQGFYKYDGAPEASPATVACRKTPKPASVWVVDEDGGAELAHGSKRRASRRSAAASRAWMRSAS